MVRFISLLFLAVLVAGVCLSATTPASAIVIRPDSEGNDPSFDTPPDSVLGAWINPTWGNGSCVVVGPNQVITTAHQGAQSGATIKLVIDGVETTFIVGDTNRHDQADLRVAKLWTEGGQPANLSDYVSLYTGTDEVGQNVIIGGWGMVRGAEVKRGPVNVIGYEWAHAELDNPSWGWNESSRTETKTQGSYTSNTIAAVFNDAEGQASIADADSGGGAFIDDDGVWKVAGLNAYVERVDESRFGDTMWFVRASSYSDWIAGIVLDYPIVPGDANWDGEVDADDFAILVQNWDPFGQNINTWETGDFTGDGTVGNADLALVLANWTGSQASLDDAMASAAFVPEPTSLAVLLTGALAVLARRRR